jgi:Cu/Ag efflux protein CusF
MNKLVAPLAVIALALWATVAQADEVTGTIAIVDSYTLILEDGTVFWLNEDVSIEGLQPGAEVTVSFEEKEGQVVVTEVKTTD